MKLVVVELRLKDIEAKNNVRKTYTLDGLKFAKAENVDVLEGFKGSKKEFV